ncbi:nitrate- and nitrite sensing domain-containing protein [Kibdelosporangium phytohabitans]|uniref:sensor histidine kinase n=1 Tax=Kibdelosporangium phytohabitans TaxID=860235 RepID=UPI00146FF835|nr:nitrate- and nitrite sensing domain-containing protein [Kibdelosporangium phytohabitans]MBE1469742.1 signal transduction histidine kinase [Kibdelosporangium phytohabitans]
MLVKIGAVLVVPVIGAMTLGTLRVRSDLDLADSYAEVERLAHLREELVPTIGLLQTERNLAMEPQGDAYRRAQWTQTDTLIDTVHWMADNTPDLGPAASSGYDKLKKELGTLPELRQQVITGADTQVLLAGYAAVIQAMVDFDRSLMSKFPDEELTGASSALFDLQVAREQVSFQHSLVLVGIRRGEMTSPERERLIEADVRLSDVVADMRSVAPPELWQRYLDTVGGSEVAQRQEYVRQARAEVPQTQRKPATRPSMPFKAPEWSGTSNQTTSLMTTVARQAAADLRAGAARLQDETSNRAGAQSVLLLAMVLLATGIGGVVGRYLLRSLSSLRRAALDVASSQLPAAVADIRAGRSAKIDPMPVRTTEEFGQLARAFDTVQNQAVRSAEEEAELRGNLRNIFVNLSRRSQGLVERQLRLMEQLEQKENDPDQLANLFKLDHLATRMRRNNENLVVLSGADLGRRFTEHVPLADVLRAAVSEVEHYERATVRSVPRVEVLGYAAGDLVRSVAELVENATAFSPPDSQVVIRTAVRQDKSVLIEIVDEGIGMGDAELADANARVAAGGGVDAPMSRQMGLFVVGSLAGRHRIGVVLARKANGADGLIASVTVPPELITGVAPAAADTPVVADVPVTPREERPPGDVGLTGKLSSVGIAVRLPELPLASSPASILFRSHKPVAVPVASEPRHAAPVTQPVARAIGQPVAQAPTQTSAQASAQPPRPDDEFAWLGGPGGSGTGATVRLPVPPSVPRARQAAAAPAPPQEDGALPKRVPKAQLFVTPMAPEQANGAGSGNGGGNGTGNGGGQRKSGPRNADRARGFLSSFQAGVRQSKTDEGEGDA